MTSLIRPSIFSDIKNIQNQMNRLFEPFESENREDLFRGTWLPPVDVAEEDDRLVVRAEIPGVKKEDIDVQFENGMLTIRGERKLEKPENGRNYHRVERIYGSFTRSFTLPASVDPDRITASYTDGVLELMVPKREEAKPKQIRIAVDQKKISS